MRVRWVLPVLALLGSCAPPAPEPPPPDESPPLVAKPEPERARPLPPAAVRDSARPARARPAVRFDPGPVVEVGLVVDAPSIPVGGGSAVTITSAAGEQVATIPAGDTWRVVREGSRVALVGRSETRSASASLLVIAPVARGLVRVGTREYRGLVTVTPGRSGVTAVNRVWMEDYLLSVVGGEMGQRAPNETEALRAQAIISRTYALRNRGRRRSLGFDYHATVADQVYFGVSAENSLAQAAVVETRGLVATWGGQPIDAFFYSTCGGRTEHGPEVFPGANRPYLRSVSDEGPSGDWCAISPRYAWREEWTGASLREALRRFLPGEAGVPASRITRVRDIRIGERTVSRRVRRLIVSLPDGDVGIASPSVREVLRPASGELLRSTAFTVQVTRTGGEVTRLVAEGHGNGHGVGLCQWGAVGRARAGHRYDQIIAAYYPGTRLERFY